MAKEIWNEGRVVGYSAYDIYVKQHLASQDPDTPPASEVEWLSASLAMGNSLLLSLPNSPSNITDSTHYTLDIPLPTDTRLGAANTIVANFFTGDGHFPATNAVGVNKGLSSSFWADKVTSYGNLILNDTNNSPSTDGNTIPKNVPDDPSSWSTDLKNKLKDYMKIIDGVVIQPGEWYTIPNAQFAPDSVKPPQKDEVQNLAKKPFIRLHIKGKIQNSPRILLTGFTIRAILAGITNTNTSTSPELRLDEEGNYVGRTAPEDGDFLGPAAYPWSNKIVFCVPNSYLAYFMSGVYERTLPLNTSNKLVSDTAVIDMNKKRSPNDQNIPTAIDPYEFYKPGAAVTPYLPDNYKANVVKYNVKDFSTLGDGTAVLTVYSKKSIYPPALYGTFVTSTGDNYLSPLDCVAPGTVKMFEDATEQQMEEYEDTFPGTVSMNKNSETGEISTVVDIDGDGDKELVPVAKISSQPFSKSNAVRIQVGKNIIDALAVSPIKTNGTNPTQYGTNGSNGTVYTISSSRFNWNDLTEALNGNKNIDILKNGLKEGQYIDIVNNGDGTYTIKVSNDIIDEILRRITHPTYEVVSGGKGIDVTKTIETKTDPTTGTQIKNHKFTVTNTLPYIPEDPDARQWKYVGTTQANLKYKDADGVPLLDFWMEYGNNKLEKNVLGFRGRKRGKFTRDSFVSETKYLSNLRMAVDGSQLVPGENGLSSGKLYLKFMTNYQDGNDTIMMANYNLCSQAYVTRTENNKKVNKKVANSDVKSSDTRHVYGSNFRAKQSGNTQSEYYNSSIVFVRFPSALWGNIMTRTSTYLESSSSGNIWNVAATEEFGEPTEEEELHVIGGVFEPNFAVLPPGKTSLVTLKQSKLYSSTDTQTHAWYQLYVKNYPDGFNSKAPFDHYCNSKASPVLSSMDMNANKTRMVGDTLHCEVEFSVYVENVNWTEILSILNRN